jgi:hypothetical protein
VVEIGLAIAATLALWALDLLNERADVAAAVGGRPAWQRWALYYTLGAATIFFGRFGGQQFIYFQF